LEGFKSLEPSVATQALKNSDAVMLGAREFLPPSGLGVVHSRRCYVFVLSPGITFNFREHVRQVPTLSFGGAVIWHWSAKLGEFGEKDSRPTSFYALQVAHSYLLVSNNLEELRTVTKRLSSSDESANALPETRDWSLVTQHKYWSYRRYNFGSTVDKRAAGVSDVTQGARGLMLFLNSGTRVVALRLYSSAEDDRTAELINSRGGLPPLKLIFAGTWETTIPLQGSEESSDELVGVMYLLGFGAYV
jgi:hypothetical protein